MKAELLRFSSLASARVEHDFNVVPFLTSFYYLTWELPWTNPLFLPSSLPFPSRES